MQVQELKKEKEVVIDEINSYMDSPSDLIFDEFDQLLFKGHSLGNDILGTIDEVKSIKRADVLKFVETLRTVVERARLFG